MSSDLSGPTGPEYLPEEPASSKSPRSGKRTALMGAAAVAVAGVVGLGGWAAVSLMSSGSQPSEAVPANALGYVSLDLDPSASQKIEAIQMLRKFPALEKEMDISSQDDLRRWAFEKIQDEGSCEDLDYDEDIAPWIGDRIALAGVPSGSEGESPMPLLALQVSDQEAASEGIDALAACGDAGDDFGFAFSGEYALISDSTEHAESIAAEAGQGTLAEDPDFQAWTDRVGEPGIVTMYAAPGAMSALVDMQGGLTDEMAPKGGPEAQAFNEAQAEIERMQESFKDLYKDFAGGAGVVRFADGALEMEVAYDGMNEALGFPAMDEAHLDVAGLPASSAVVLGASLPEGWADAYIDLMRKGVGDDQAMDQMLGMLEGQSGLEIPEDIESLLGDGFAFTLDKDMDLKAAERDPNAVPGGILITGDPGEIVPVVDKIKRLLGPDAGALVVEEGDGVVALGLNRDYVGRLVDAGGLDGADAFRDAVPEADKVAGLVYVDFDSIVGWMDQADEDGQLSPDDKKLRDNLEPLRALGLSSWAEGDVAHTMLRISTD